MVLRSVCVIALGSALGSAAAAAAAETRPRTTLKSVRLVETTLRAKPQIRLGFTACGATGRLRVRVREIRSPAGKNTPALDEMTRSTVFRQSERCQRTVVFWQPRKAFLDPGRYTVRLSVSAGERPYSAVVSRHVDRTA
jgi:hypothetical protein